MSIRVGSFVRILPGVRLWRVIAMRGQWAQLGDHVNGHPLLHHHVDDLRRVPYEEGRLEFARRRRTTATSAAVAS